jgi:UDP-2-acetamido-2-deoxy-ribo-hexuluronate aminotransferase
VQFIDLQKQYSLLESEIDKAIKAVLKHGQYINGPEVSKLESVLSKYVGTKHCISCSSGTDALLMSLMAKDIGPGDAVFTSPFTFIATAEVIKLLGATPIFVDIDKTFNIDPAKLLESIDNCILDKKLIPKAILPVNIFGLLAGYESINKIKEKYKLYVIEDAAQSFGATYKNKKSCSFGDVGATSFFPAKPLGAYGDGGAIFTNDDDIAKKLFSIREHGQGMTKYDNVYIGINGRLDTIQASILLEKIKLFPEELEKRDAIAEKYNKLLFKHYIGQNITKNNKSAWAQYSILAKNEIHRLNCIKALNKFNIPTSIYYPKPLHLQEAFKDLDYKEGDFPFAESIANKIFSLPMHPYLKDDEVGKIAEVLIKCKN